MTLQAAARPAPTLFVLIVVSMAQPVAMNMYLPAIAAIREDLATSAAMIQLTISVYLAATAVGLAVVGPLSDLFGRRPVLLGGMAIFTVGSLICAHAGTIELMLFGRVVQAIGGCTGLSLSRAMVRDLHGADGAASMIGYVTMGMAVAPMVTPALGGLIHERYGWRLNFDLMALFGGVVLLLAYLRLGETHPNVGGGGGFASWLREAWKLLMLRDFWLYGGTLSFLSMVFFSFMAGGPIIAVDVFHLTPSAIGSYFFLIALGYILGNFLAGRYSRRLGINRMIRSGVVISILSVATSVLLFLGLDDHPLELFVPMFFAGLGNGIALPNAISGAVSVRPALAGTAAGLSGTFQVGGGALIAIIVGILIDLEGEADTVWPMMVPMATGACLAVLVGFLCDARRLPAAAGDAASRTESSPLS